MLPRASSVTAVAWLGFFTACAADAAPSAPPDTSHAGETSAMQPVTSTPAAGSPSRAADAGETPAGRSAAPANSAGVAAVGGTGGMLPAGMGAAGQVPLAGSSGMSAAGASGAAGRAVAGAGGAGAGGSAGAASAPADISVWIAGDSTVANGETPCPVGWGADFQSLFNAHTKVVNSAVGGRSVRTWLYDVQTTMDSSGECVLAKDATGLPTLQPRWQAMLDGMKPGDYLMIQFGINDSSATCDRHVGLEAFKESYGMMAGAAKMRGAQPIFLTPVSAISCNGSTARGTRGGYVTATQEAGQKYDVPVIDLHALSVALYTSLGLCPIPGGSDVSASTGGKTGSFFCDDHTHFERTGAAQIAQLITQALRDQKLGLADYLK